MNFSFDYFDQFETPSIYLTNPDGTPLYMIGSIFDRNLKLRFNALSEFSFTADKIINEIENDYYDSLDYRRIINIDGIGNFMITQIDETNDGIIQEKKIICQSLECELSFKKLSLFEGTYKFWDLFDPVPTLMGQMLLYLPGWSMGYVDPDLPFLYRTFSETDITIYDFLMNKVSQSYQCIFSFNSINKVINVYTTNTATTQTDIFLSYQNLVDNVDIKEITEELVTALNVLGGGNLDIHQVNPLGTNTIYNFDYYKNVNWMSGSLITAIDNWETKISASQVLYANKLTEIFNENTILLQKEAELSLLKTAPYPDGLDALREVQVVRIRQGLDIQAINALIVAKEVEINAKQFEINTINNQISIDNDYLKTINSSLSFANNFTQVQQLELSNFIIGSTYTNETFIQTDIMSGSDIQLQAQGLYDQAVQILAKISQPRYTFDVNSANFVFLKEFQIFINQLVLGAIVTVEFNDGHFAYPALLGIDYSYDDPNNFKMIFSNRLRLDDSAFQFNDLFSQSISTGLSTTFNSEQWSSWQKYSKNDVTTFINSALDASKNAVLNATNQEIIIDKNGLRGRYLDPNTNAYDPRQVWLINNMMVFTDTNWNSAALAIGQITNPTGGSSYGLVADVIVGRLLAGNELIIENDSNTFTLNGSGATLLNANFTIRNNINQILLDPNSGIEISKKDIAGNFTDKKFYIDTYGNVVFSGSLVAASGTFNGTINASSGYIGGWEIKPDGLYSPFSDYIKSNGDIRLSLMTINRSAGTATFNGDIFARNLKDYVLGTQIKDIIADTITSGKIMGIEIDWPGVRMYSPVYGTSAIEASNQIGMYSGNSYITITPNTVNLAGNLNTTIGNITNIGQTNLITSQLNVVDSGYNQGTGITESFIITTSSGSRLFNFINGILCNSIITGSSGSTSGSTSGSGIIAMIFNFDSDSQGWIDFNGSNYGRWVDGTLESKQLPGGAGFWSNLWRYSPSGSMVSTGSCVLSYSVTTIVDPGATGSFGNYYAGIIDMDNTVYPNLGDVITTNATYNYSEVNAIPAGKQIKYFFFELDNASGDKTGTRLNNFMITNIQLS